MTDPNTRTAHTPWCTATYSHLLEEITAAGVDLVLALIEHDDRFRPNLVFTSTPHTGPVSDAQVAAVQAAPLQHPGAVLTGVDVWGDNHAGRRLSFLYPVDDEHDVWVTKWVFATGTHHVHVTASMLPFQWVWANPIFDTIVATLDFATAPLVQTFADDTEFMLDYARSQASDVPIERLDIVQGTHIPAGFPLSLTARELLIEATTPRLFRGARTELPARTRGTESAEQLARSGLIDAGTVTERGTQIARVLRDGELVCELWMQFDGRTEALRLISDGRDAVISRTSGMGDPYPEGEVSLEPIAHELIPRWLFTWLDLTPRYLVAEARDMHERDIELRLGKPLTAGGWRKVTVSVPDELQFSLLETDHGDLFIGEAGELPDRVRLESFSPTQLVEQVLSGLSAKLLPHT